jgi:hypothetical protein
LLHEVLLISLALIHRRKHEVMSAAELRNHLLKATLTLDPGLVAVALWLLLPGDAPLLVWLALFLADAACGTIAFARSLQGTDQHSREQVVASRCSTCGTPLGYREVAARLCGSCGRRAT